MVRYLTANAAWVYDWNGQIIDLDGRRLFDTRRELVSALGACGLAVARNGVVFVDDL